MSSISYTPCKLSFWHINKVLIIIVVSFVTVFAGVLFVHQPGADHAPGASVTQVNDSVHELYTFLRAHAHPTMQIFWISVTVAVSHIFWYFHNVLIIIIIIIIIITIIITIIIIIIIIIKYAANLACFVLWSC